MSGAAVALVHVAKTQDFLMAMHRPSPTLRLEDKIIKTNKKFFIDAMVVFE